MALSAASVKITGNPTQTSWVQVHDFTPSEKEKLQARGRLVALLAVERQDHQAGSIDSVEFGREILSRLHEEYYGSLKKPRFKALKAAVVAVQKEFAGQVSNLSVGAISFDGDVLYTSLLGTKAYLLRTNELVPILAGENKVVTASGRPAAGDFFLVGTNEFFQVLPEGTVKGAFAAGDLQEAIQNLAPALHSAENKVTAGAFALSFKDMAGVSASVPKIEKPASLEPKIVSSQPRRVFPLRVLLANFLGGIIRILPEKPIRVREEVSDLETQRRKKVAATAGAILVLLLIISIGFGVKQKREHETRSAYEPRLIEAQYEFEEAKELASLNPSRSRELVLGAKTKAQALKDEGVEDSELIALLAEIDSNLAALAGIYEAEVETFNLGIISNGFRGEKLSLSDDYMLILDQAGEKLVSMKIDTKKTKVEASSDVIKEPLMPAAYAQENYLLTKEGVFKIDAGESEQVIERDWGEDSLFYVYAGNAYLLDKHNEAIWRYPVINEGFGAQQNWFGAGIAPDLSNTISWSIDGAVWLLSASGKVSKFNQGSPETFRLDNLEVPMTSPLAIYANEENEYLYFLDAVNSRINIFNKKGEFKGEYLADELKEGIDLVASEKEGKIAVLAGEKLYFVKIKH